MNGIEIKSLLPELEISGLTHDSRQVLPGWLFVALPGLKVQGVEFIPQALDNGAVAVVGPIAGLISDRVMARMQTTTGIFIQLGGLFMLGMVIPNIPFMVLAVVIMATGMSLFTVANGNFVMTAAPSDCTGVVSALINISRTTGFSVATALATAMFTLFQQIIIQGDGSALGFVGIYTLSVSYVIFSYCIFVVFAIIISASRGSSPAEEGGFDSLIVCDE